jgi:non-ribosomal peptide synthetase component F
VETAAEHGHARGRRRRQEWAGVAVEESGGTARGHAGVHFQEVRGDLAREAVRLRRQPVARIERSRVSSARRVKKLVEELNPRRNPAYNPIFQLMLGYHERGSAGLVLPRCRVSMTAGETSTAKLDLSLNLTRTKGRLSARLEYSTDLFEKETARALAERFRAVLTTAVTDPEQSIGDLVRRRQEQEAFQ